ncbi:hypothetical protein BDV32DRAFT_124631 [Aspergillus pseudonomiae]|uniref:CFEM domain-containing protein n=1 Tax=Aspergillus pseudonomiae TaxID=1506151 RepID=A0A5N6HXN4_9EURO|nr:uncharacterized protein BDV37DRAFT_246812 [Aspergillus pseudonomiae]KAB8259166.1 hypothetical protein BDV32DRAFT_124631 [Aspergillus pseudonomiae]KAE8404724.1 hypothetical protein BDV37DRAFT_246812 [Aspergillus pseudonomiae]
MKVATSVALASLLAMAQAHPSGAWWGTDDCYTSPDNTNNECSDEMRGGFNWAGLTAGSFDFFAGFAFSGFSFSSSFSAAVGGGFAGQCIESKLSKDDETSPEISSGSDKTFSISKLHLVTGEEAEIKIIYDMPDGSSCKHVAPCSPKGTVVANDQCGGASSVRFELAEEASVDAVVFGIQNVEFECSAGQKTPTPSHHHTSPTATGHSSTPVIPVPSSSDAVTPPAPSTPVKMTTSTVYTTSLITITSCAPTVTNCPGDSTTVVTSTIAVSTTVCPVTSTETPTKPTETPGKPTGTPGKPTGSSPVGGSSEVPSPSSPAPTGTAGTSSEVHPTSHGGSSSLPPDSTTTVVTWETLTTCPVTTTATSGGVTTTSVYSTVSTVTLTSTSTICTKCTATPTGKPTGTPTGTSPTPTGVSPEEPPEDSTTTVVTYTTVTDCPVTTTATAGGTKTTSVFTTQSTVTLTSISTVCTKCSATPAPTGVEPISTPAGGATTVVTYETVTTCPVTTTITSGGSTTTSVFTTVSTVTKTSSSAVKPTDVPPAPAPSSPAPSTECPNSVPKCINTWLPLLPKCTSNADPGCFCPSHEFTDKVISCIQAWGASKEEIQSALSYFTGICAPYIPGNPGIVTGIPSTITLIPTPRPTGVAPVTGTSVAPHPTAGPEVPCTTITYSTYTVTVPQVTFSTGTSGHSTTVGLIPGPAPTGVSPGHSSGIPNPWVSGSSTWISSHRPSATAKPSSTQTPPPLANTASSVSASFWLAMGVAALFSIFF